MGPGPSYAEIRALQGQAGVTRVCTVCGERRPIGRFAWQGTACATCRERHGPPLVRYSTEHLCPGCRRSKSILAFASVDAELCLLCATFGPGAG